jgi:hypothetical protein
VCDRAKQHDTQKAMNDEESRNQCRAIAATPRPR